MNKFFLMLCSALPIVAVEVQPALTNRNLQERFIILLDRYNQKLDTAKDEATTEVNFLRNALLGVTPVLISKSL